MKPISLRALNKATLEFPHFVGITKDEVRIISRDDINTSTENTYSCVDHTGYHEFKLQELKGIRPAKGEWVSYGFIPNHYTYSIIKF